MIPLSKQLTDKSSLFNHYKEFIYLRNKSYALTYGDLIPVDIADPSICAFVRSDLRESVLVIHNLSNVEINIRLPDKLKQYMKIVFTNKTSQLNDNQVKIPGYCTLILGN